MEYVFGDSSVKVVSDRPITMTGTYTIERKYDTSYITDTFKIVRETAKKEADGLYYAWYEITDHTRYEDKFTPNIKLTEQEITEQELALIEAEQTITDLDLRLMELEANN